MMSQAPRLCPSSASLTASAWRRSALRCMRRGRNDGDGSDAALACQRLESHRGIATQAAPMQVPRPCIIRPADAAINTNHRIKCNPTIAMSTSHAFTITRRMSDEIRRGTDLLADSLAHGARRKIVLESYAPSGVDVKGFVQVGDSDEEGESAGEDKIVHMNGSIVAFPDTCFLWNVTTPKEVNLETLSVVRLYQPVVEYLFIGCDKPMPPRELNKIKKEFRKKDIVVEQMDVMNAMGTFNILNGEDRRVACVLVIDPEEG